MPELEPNQNHNEPSDKGLHPQQTITVGALAVDMASGWVIFDNQQIGLTAHEYKFIACLAQNLGRILGEEELLAQVWGCETGGIKSQVKNLVWRLRQKIEPEPERPVYILTARGRGYYMPSHITDAYWDTDAKD